MTILLMTAGEECNLLSIRHSSAVVGVADAAAVADSPVVRLAVDPLEGAVQVVLSEKISECLILL